MTEKAVAEIILKGLEDILVSNEYPLNKKRLEKLIQNMLAQKRELNKVLGLSHENLYRTTLPYANEEFLSLWNEHEHYLRTNLSERLGIPYSQIHFNWSTNKVSVGKNVYKISKLINQHQEMFEYFLNQAFEKYQIKSLTQLIDIVKNENKVIFISTNPLDILTCSYNASFTSCFRPRGQYATAALMLAQSYHTGIAYISDKDKPEYKHGRCFFHVSCDEPIFQIGKGYPEQKFQRAQKIMVRQFIMKKLDEFFGKEHDWLIKSDNILDQRTEVNRFYYYDDNQQVGADRELWNYGLSTFEFDEPECIYCGGWIDDSHTWLCDECSFFNDDDEDDDNY